MRTISRLSLLGIAILPLTERQPNALANLGVGSLARSPVSEQVTQTTSSFALTARVRGVILGRDTILLTDHTFSNVERLLGPTRPIKIGKRHDGVDGRCYIVTSDATRGFLTFLSNEMGGAEQDVLGLRLSLTAPPGIPVDGCSAATQNQSAIVLMRSGASIGLGTDSARVYQIVGRLKKTRHGQWERNFELRDSVTVQKDTGGRARRVLSDISGYFTVSFVKGKLSFLEAWEIATS
jgi:hypothetical protein